MSTDGQRMQPRTIYLAAALAVLVVLCLALSICFIAGPRPASLSLAPVAPTDSAAQSGEEKFTTLFDGPLGPFTVSLTEEEATSLLALRLPGSPFLEPQVRFAGERVHVSGIVNMGVSLRVASIWSVSQTGGRPRLALERAAIGPFALSSFLLSSVSSTMNEMIDESGTGIVATQVTIREGQITVSGRKDTPSIP